MQAFDLAFGTARVFYPQVSETRCTAALLLDIDPVGLVRTRRGPAGEGGLLQQYVNDRPYAASSFLSVAIGDVFRSALKGVCKERPALVDQALPLEAVLPVIPVRGGEAVLRELFEPLGYEVTASRHPLDERFPEWGDSSYFGLTLRHTVPLKHLLTHLYVLVPVLDNDKHYWVGQDEVEKLLARGEGWLQAHPAREFIVDRYLKGFRALTREALARLSEGEGGDDPEADDAAAERAEEQIERPLSLNDQRHAAVLAALKGSGARSVLDLGCAQGKLLRRLFEERQFDRVVGLDVSLRSLEEAADRLKLDRLTDRQKARIELLHGSLLYRDERLAGFDAACLVEVIEHLDPPRLRAMERSVFGAARPTTVVVTTPNVEYNVRFPTLLAGQLRHGDHRFEWSRDEFRRWAERVATEHGYAVRFLPIGLADPEVGSPTQMAIFTLPAGGAASDSAAEGGG